MDVETNKVGEVKNCRLVSVESNAIYADAIFENSKENRHKRLREFANVMDADDFKRLYEGLALFDNEPDVMTEDFERSLEQYFDTLVYFLEKAIEKYNSRSDDALLFCRAVEELHQINCYKNKVDNSYFISRKHPVLLMNERLDIDTENLLTDCREKGNDQEYAILRTVFDAEMRNRGQVKLFSRNAVYETISEDKENQDYIKAKLFQHSESHTKIPVIRIWEKIDKYLAVHPEKRNEQVKIATFGKLEDSEYNAGKGLLEDLLGVSISWTVFHREASMGEYFFADELGELLYDIMDSKDLQELIDSFQLILFLDENCFYRQRQAKKEVQESGEGVNCRWNYERAVSRKEFKNKAVYYRLIYNRAGQWLNSANEEMSAAFEFDERLYRSLEAVSKRNTDIFLYIKYGSKIGTKNLAASGVCNDEYYDGISLTVCKLAESDDTFNGDYSIFLKQPIQKDNLYVRIKFWKLLKSISNEYCDSILEQYSHGKKELLAQILRTFSNSYLILKYEVNSEIDKVRILYKLEISKEYTSLDVLGELSKVIENVTEVVLKYAFAQEKLYCINRYFEKLLVHSVISNANDIGDLVFAHWIATNWYETEKLEKGEFDYQIDTNFSVTQNRFKVRKTAYAMIERLEDLRMRSGQDMKAYFLGTFRGEVCPDVEPDNIVKTFCLIKECCEHFNHTGSSLYVNSKLIPS